MSIEHDVTKRWEVAAGTPKSLENALANAMAECIEKGHITGCNDPIPAFQRHVKDYLAQKFQLFMSGDGSIVDTTVTVLWEKIMGIK